MLTKKIEELIPNNFYHHIGWYFAEQWRRYLGNNWQQTKCDSWVKRDRMLKRYANELPMVCFQNLYPTFQYLNIE